MVVTLLVPMRKIYKLENLITLRHLDNMNKIILATGSLVGLAYGTEFFIAWYSKNRTKALPLSTEHSVPIGGLIGSWFPVT